MAQIDDLQNTFNAEIPRRDPTLTNAIVSYDDNPNLGGAPSILQLAPLGTWFYEETANIWWRKKSSSPTDWKESSGSGGGGGVVTEEALTIVIDESEVLGTSVDPPVGEVFSSQAEWDDYLTQQSATGYKTAHLVGLALPHVIAHRVEFNFEAGPNTPRDGLTGATAVGTEFDKKFIEKGSIILNGPSPSTWIAIDPSLASLTIDSFQTASQDPWMDFGTSHSGVFVGLEAEIRGSLVVADNGYVGVISGVVGDKLELISVISPAPVAGVTTIKIARPSASWVQVANDAFTPIYTLGLKGNDQQENDAFGTYELNWFDFPHVSGKTVVSLVKRGAGQASTFQCTFSRRVVSAAAPCVQMLGANTIFELFECSLVSTSGNGSTNAFQASGLCFLTKSYVEGWDDGVIHEDGTVLRIFSSIFRNVGGLATDTRGSLQNGKQGGIDIFTATSETDRVTSFIASPQAGFFTNMRGGISFGPVEFEPQHGAIFTDCKKSCIVIGDGAAINWQVDTSSFGFIDGGGNLAYGIEFQGANAHILLSTVDDVSGALGDILMADGAEVTYAELLVAGSITDSKGNTIEQF